MKQVELKLTVTIHKVKLQVKFPCSLTAALKVQNDEISFGQDAPLKLGEAVLQLAATQKFSLFMDSFKNTFSQKKISIVVYLKSSSGRIPAGAAFININSLRKGSINSQVLNIEKCPDKHATIDTGITLDILDEIDFYPSNENIRDGLGLKQEPLSYRQGYSRDRKSQSKMKNQLTGSGSLYGKDSPNRGSQILSVQNDKIRQLQRSKVEAERQIANLKNQMKNSSTYKKSEQNSQKGDVNYISQSPLVEYGIRTKNSEMERQLKNVQKKYQQQNLQLKNANSKKEVLERTLKQVEGQLKIFRQKYEDTVSQHENHVKRTQFKQNSYKQQIKSLSQKLTYSQSQKQKMIFQKNDLVTDFEQREKMLRQGMRDKEKTFNQQKSKLLKKLQQTTKQYTESQSLNFDTDTKLAQITKQLNAQRSKNQTLQINKIELTKEVQGLNDIILQQKIRREQLQQNLGFNQELEEDKKKLKKKITEQEQQIAKNIKNMANLESNLQKSLKKCEQTQNALKQKISANKGLQKDIQALIKQLQNTKKSNQDKDKKLEEVGFVKQNQSVKIDNLIQEMRQIEKKYQEQLKLVRSQNKEKDNTIEQLHEQFQHLNDSLGQMNKKNAQLEMQLSELHKNVNNLQQDHEEVLKVKEQLDDFKNELQIKLNGEIHQKEQMDKTYKQQIQEKNSVIRSLEQKIIVQQNQMASKDEETYYQTTQLQRKITDLEKDIASKLQQIVEYKQILDNLRSQKQRSQGSNEELQYTLKLKNNQINFLKETVQKCNSQIAQGINQNKQQSVQIQKLKETIQQLQLNIQNLEEQLKNASSTGSETKQQLDTYKQKNRDFLKLYFEGIKGGLIQVRPEHHQQSIMQLMCNVIERNNKYVNEKQTLILKLTAQLQEANETIINLKRELEETLTSYEHLQATLNDQRNKNDQNSKFSQFSQQQMKQQLQIMMSNNQKLQDELSEMRQIRFSLQQQLQTLNHALEQKSEENLAFKLQIDELEDFIKEKQAEFSNNQSQQSGKFLMQIASLENKIKQTLGLLDDQTKKTQQSTAKLNQTTKQYKDYQRRAEDQSKTQKQEIDRQNKLLQQNRKQIQVKGTAITRYGQIEQTLRDSLKETRNQITNLKEINETVRKRNQKGSNREKELEDVIETLKKNQVGMNQKQLQLQKSIKQKNNEIVVLREQGYKLEKQKTKLIQDGQILGATIKVKGQGQLKLQDTIKSLQKQLSSSVDKSKLTEKSFTDKQNSMKRQIISLTESKQKLQKDLTDMKQKFFNLEAIFSSENKNNSESSKQLNQDLNNSKIKIKQLQEKIASLNKSLQQQQKAHALDDTYLKPIKQNVSLLKGYMNEYSRVGDNFQSNKNKLLKMAATKIEGYNDKYVGQKIKDISSVFQKLKTNILTSKQLNEGQKDTFSEQLKKVQSVIDRVLRGDR